MSRPSTTSAHFVLDQNFPWYATAVVWPSGLKISRLGDIEPTLTYDKEDWEVILGLDRREDVNGFITNDAKMLMLPSEMVALSRTRLAVVIPDDVGDQPIRATGLVMVHIGEIAKSLDGRPQIFRLRARQVKRELPKDHLDRIAGQLKQRVNDLIFWETQKMGLRP